MIWELHAAVNEGHGLVLGPVGRALGPTWPTFALLTHTRSWSGRNRHRHGAEMDYLHQNNVFRGNVCISPPHPPCPANRLAENPEEWLPCLQLSCLPLRHSFRHVFKGVRDDIVQQFMSTQWTMFCRVLRMRMGREHVK